MTDVDSTSLPPFVQCFPELTDEVKAAKFPKTILRFRTQRAAAKVGLDRLADDE